MKVLPTEECPLTVIKKSYNKFDKEYYFILIKCMPERIKAVMKTRRGATKY